MSSGISIAIDYGLRRIGVARCDSERILALPVTTVSVDRYGGHFDELIDLFKQYQAQDVFIGFPAQLSGQEGEAAQGARRFARALACRIRLPIRLVDERLTTVQAHSQLNQVGRATRDRRAIIDQASAVVLLEHVLESERRTGALPGQLVTLRKHRR